MPTARSGRSAQAHRRNAEFDRDELGKLRILFTPIARNWTRAPRSEMISSREITRTLEFLEDFVPRTRERLVHDLSSILESSSFSFTSSDETRIAFVHHSFRSVSVRRKMDRFIYSSHFPALGLLNLAHALRVDAGRNLIHQPDLRYFDEECFENSCDLIEEIKEWLRPAKRRIVAASTYTSTIDKVEEFFSKFEADQYLMIAGGAHATTAPDVRNVHIAVRGEGRRAFQEILNNLGETGFHPYCDHAGLTFTLRGHHVSSPVCYDRSIEELQSPCFAYDLLPPEHQQRQIYATNFKRMLGRRPMIYICTQSCRARCTFCSTYLVHGKCVARPISKIAADLQHLVHDLGYDSIEFHDDDIFQHPQLAELLEVVGKLGVPWFCYGRAEAIDAGLAAGLASAGCQRVFLGLEAMDQPTLDYFNKRTSAAQNASAVAFLSKAGVGVIAGFIVGAPHHTSTSILHALDQFLDLDLLAINVSILSPDPGTVEFQRALKWSAPLRSIAHRTNKSLRVAPDVAQFGSEVPIGLPAVCKAVSKEVLNDLVRIIEVEFYARPMVRKRLLRGIPPEQAAVVAGGLNPRKSGGVIWRRERRRAI